MNNDLISREALKKHKFPINIGDGVEIKEIEVVPVACIDNAPTVSHERLQGDCEKCDFRKFTETFIDGVVDVMNKNGITSVEQLSKILKGGAYEQ